jgi:putative ABC transport system ATP-binding protein
MRVLVDDCAEAGSALMFVSHDPRLAAGFDRAIDIGSLAA